MSNLVRKDSIEELCGHRARALELYQRAAELLVAAQVAHKRAAAGATASGYPHDQLRYMGPEDPAKFARSCQTNIDRDMWRALILGTRLGGMMDATERKRFEDSIEKEPPEITPETVFATMDRLAKDAGQIFRRGLVEAFRRLSGDYRSHDGFKIGDRMVLTGAFYLYNKAAGLGHFQRDEVCRDVDRVMHILDGLPAPELYSAGVVGAIRDAVQKRLMQCETPYWRVRWFQNGNMHLWPKRDDLVRQANQLIAEHFGNALGAGPDARRAA